MLGSALLVLLACAIEASLIRWGDEGMGAVLASLFVFKSWGGPSLFEYSRVFPVYLVVLLISRRAFRKFGTIPVVVQAADGAAPRDGELVDGRESSLAPTPH
jgi:hypothetical protein